MESPKDRPGKPDVAKQTMSDGECLDIAIPLSSKAAQAFLAWAASNTAARAGSLSRWNDAGARADVHAYRIFEILISTWFVYDGVTDSFSTNQTAVKQLDRSTRTMEIAGSR